MRRVGGVYISWKTIIMVNISNKYSKYICEQRNVNYAIIKVVNEH